jgi:hypothetical protein
LKASEHIKIAAILRTWSAKTAKIEPTQPPLPVTVLAGEAQDLAYVLEAHWQPVEGDASRPGMQGATVSGLFDERIAAELLELAQAVLYTHAKFRSIKDPVPVAPVARGEFLLSELKNALEFLFDDNKQDPKDGSLARLTESHFDTSSQDALAMSLEGFAFFAHGFRDRLALLPGFDPAMIDEAVEVAHRVRSQSYFLQKHRGGRTERSQTLELRNCLTTLLVERMSAARRAARYLFRHDPEVLELFGSAYEQRKRARKRTERGARRRDASRPTE